MQDTRPMISALFTFCFLLAVCVLVWALATFIDWITYKR